MLSNWIFGAELPTWALFVEIVLAGAAVVVSGSRLASLADGVADKYQLGSAWVGALLLATVTSLPEVVSGMTATWVGQTDMAFSAIFGSCSFNILLILLLNAFIGGGSILTGMGRSHSVSCSFGIVLMSIALFGITLVDKFQDNVRVAQICEWSVVGLMVVTYMACMRMVFRVGQAPAAPVGNDTTEAKKKPADHLLGRVAFVSMILVVAAWWLARTGDVLAEHPIEALGRPLGATFVGFLFLAIATSLPEIATGVASVRMGNLDMALGNIFGSNMFNIFVVPFLKLVSVFAGDELLMQGEDFHPVPNMIAGMLPILMTAVVVGSISYGRGRTVLGRLGVDSALLAAIYVAGMILLLM